MKFNIYTLIILVLNAYLTAACNNKLTLPESRDDVLLIESFRSPGMSDQLTIEKAIKNAPEGSKLMFDNKSYTINHTVLVDKSLSFSGPATFIRENQKTYVLTSVITPESRQVHLNTTEGLRVNDWVLITNGKVDSKSTTGRNLITSISDNMISLYYPVGSFLDLTSNFSVGNLLLKDIRFFEVAGERPGELATHNCTFEDIVFDGNRNHNEATRSWLLHYSLMASCKGKTVIKNCTFINSPGESIVGHNLYVSDCIFKDLNGSAIHTAIDRLQVDEDHIHSEFIRNKFENTNEVSTKITGHSEGCITHSNSGGYYTAKHNQFINVGEAVLGLLYPSVSRNDWGTSNILFTENEIKTPGRLVYSFGMLTGKLENVRIVDNNIYELNGWNWDKALEHYPDVKLENEVNKF